MTNRNAYFTIQIFSIYFGANDRKLEGEKYHYEKSKAKQIMFSKKKKKKINKK